MARRSAPVKLRRWETEMTVDGPSNRTVSSSAVSSQGTSCSGVRTVPLASSQSRVKVSSPNSTVNSGLGRRPSVGAVAERWAMATRASARRWAAVRSLPWRRSAR